MAKHHPKRQDQFHAGRTTRGAGEGTFTAHPPAGQVPAPAAKAPEDDGNVGNYWVVILLWAVGFLALIAFELVAAISRN